MRSKIEQEAEVVYLTAEVTEAYSLAFASLLVPLHHGSVVRASD